MRTPLVVSLLALGVACTPAWVGDSGDPASDDTAALDDCGADPSDPTRDTDGDRIPDAEERSLGTDPCLRDSDDDGVSDGVEIDHGSNPTNAVSTPDIGVVEVDHGGEGTLELSFTLEIQRADVAFLLDTTGSMGSLTNAMASEFSAIVGDLSGLLPDASYGVATFDDYAYGGFGSAASGDKPFILLQQQTTDTARVQAELAAIQLHGGSDGPESTMEALYQAVTGAGFDQDCDGTYDATTDVLPFTASSSDPFGGTAGGVSEPTPGGGTTGGLGFRRGALPILVYGTDATLRDPDAGHGVPPGCPGTAGASDVTNALSDIGGRLIGIGVGSTGGGGYAQMVSLANATGSLGDLDGNGTDEPMVVKWWTGGGSFRSTVVAAVSQLVGALTFGKVDLDYTGPGAQFVTHTSPEAHYDVGAADFGTPLEFTVHLQGAVAPTAQDQVFELDFALMGDDAVLLAQRRALVVVPGTGL